MGTKFLVLFFSLLLAGQTFGAVTLPIFDTSRFSRGVGKDLGDSTLQNNIIYGGISGTCTGSSSSSSTCNSCIGTPSTGCNTRRIHDSLLFSVTLKTDTAGTIYVATDFSPGSGQTSLNFSANVTTSSPIAKNTTFTVYVPWSEICKKTFLMTDCDTVGVGNITSAKGIRIGVSADNTTLDSGEYLENLQFVIADIGSGTSTLCTEAAVGTPAGVCNFIAWPGDEKIALEQVRTDCGFPGVDNSGANIQAVRVFYTEDDNTDAHPTITTATSVDLPIGTTTQTCTNLTKIISVEETDVTGLSNNTPYRFAAGVVDEAFNVGFVTQHNNLAPTVKTDCYGGATDDWPQNCHIATPADVVGLIEEEFDCFITTATYGSPFRPKVEVFRHFRNQYLKTNLLGRKIIQTYYKYSPPIAYWIRNNPQVKPAMRVVLWPLWFFAKTCLEYPLLILLGMLGSLLLLARRINFRGVLK